ncbi:acyltransferase family protein [Luteococcus sp. Sow4_B9]|uniref:acyltransferase family protein n=1 Tax=Luteococcus sp. Sow4_B9 TaxID=3438792 RepID=UPI003F9738FE
MPRAHALDGLRGVAALVVVFHHCMLLFPTLADLYRDRGAAMTTLPWFSLTPGHLLWDGDAAVLAFFVLSGLVLTPSFLPGDRPWLPYYAGRLPRLYLPVIGSVALALAWAVLVPRVADPAMSWWTLIHVDQVQARGTLDSIILLFGISSLNTPLWSLQWEMWFSLLLPLYIWIVRRAGSRSWWLLPVCLALVAWGTHADDGRLKYLPVFMIGVVLASQAQTILTVIGGWGRTRGIIWMTGCLVLANAPWWPIGASALSSSTWKLVSQLLMVGAATGLVAYLLGNRRMEAWGTRPTIAWLGSRSFSLYLTHEPLVVSLQYLLGAEHRVLAVVMAIPLALVLAELFFRLVERPSHAVSRRAAQWAKKRS